LPFFDLAGDQLVNYRSSARPPADFDAFWAETLGEASRFPLSALFEPVDAGLPLVDVYDVTFLGFGGHPIKAWFLKPRGASSGLTGVVRYIGYNGGRGFPHEHLLWPATGRAALIMDTRGQGGGWSRGATADPVGSDPAHTGYMTRGILDPRAYFYRRVFTDAVRAVEALRTRPEVDQDQIVAMGGSQGGGITLAASGLVTGLRAVMPDVPFLCDFPRAVGLTTRDPYGEVNRYLALHRDNVERAFLTLSYFDGVHFAARASAPALFSVALMDDVCPPSTVYAAFNSYGGPKSIERYAYNNHEGGGPFQEERQLRWLAEQGI
jgi:cephalosporin-C deacetylase